MSSDGYDDRPLRVCDLCGAVDRDPRHVIAGGVGGLFQVPGEEIVNKVLETAPAAERGRLLRDLMDTASSDRHLDCCAAANCPTDTCGPQTRDAGGKTGKAMLKHLTSIEDRFADRPDVVKGE